MHYTSEPQTRTSRLTIESATMLTFSLLRIEVSPEFSEIPFVIEKNGRPIDFHVIRSEPSEQGTMEIDVRVPHSLSLDAVYTVFHPGHETVVFTPKEIVHTDEFERRYAYDGPLGVQFSPKHLDVHVWSPVAFSMSTVIYDRDTMEELARFKMHRHKKGVWHTQLPNRFRGQLYRLLVRTPNWVSEVVDPYAKSVSLNGEYGVLIHVEELIAQQVERVERPPLRKATDAVIYELNIRDFTSQQHCMSQKKGLYASVYERGVKTPAGNTAGLDYLKELGVTHLQLLPVHDFGSVDEKTSTPYNWGYDPIHWFAIEGSYSSDPSHPETRMIEYAQMIAELHRVGIRVVFDVVMNHIFVRETSSLEALVPHYYFRYEIDGSIGNGTGVGNDTASERYMMRRLIVDCVTFFAEVYQVDGFRFDLMGIHDTETMNQVRSSLDRIDRSILVYGEGWDLATPLSPSMKAMSQNAPKMPRISHFNDMFRDAIKGSSFNERDRGFISGNVFKQWEMRECVVGGVRIPNVTIGRFPSPQYTINYAEAHDNHTMFDKLALACPDVDEEKRLRMQLLGTAIVIMSQGIPFLHAGQEFARTKQGIENSYNAPDTINQLDWTLRDRHAYMVDYVRTLIRLRRRHTAFRYDTREKVVSHFKFLDSPAGVIAYELSSTHSYDAWKRVRVYLNGTFDDVLFDLGDTSWNVFVEGERASLTPLLRNQKQIRVESLSMTIIAC